MIPIIKKHTFFLVYSFMLFIISYGVFLHSKFNYVGYVLMYLGVFIIFYILLNKFIRIKIVALLKSKNEYLLNQQTTGLFILYGAAISVGLFIISHYIYLESIPALKAWNTTNYYDIIYIRRNITENSSWIWNYGSSFMVKSIIPVTLFVAFYQKKKWLYWCLFILCSFYGFSLMQKSYIITIVLPLIIFSIYQKKYLYTTKYIITIVGIIYALLYVTNPDLRPLSVAEQEVQENIELITPDNAQKEKGITAFERNNRFIYGIYKRVFVVPGAVVSNWFTYIPSDLPYLDGCGYRFVVPFKNCNYRDYARELYPYVKPQYYKRGIIGNINVASFMYEYSNFGWIGLIFSALILSIIFITCESLFDNLFIFKLSLCMFPILILSSTSLTTLLFSGGWGLTIIQFFIYKHFNFFKK